MRSKFLTLLLGLAIVASLSSVGVARATDTTTDNNETTDSLSGCAGPYTLLHNSHITTTAVICVRHVAGAFAGEGTYQSYMHHICWNAAQTARQSCNVAIGHQRLWYNATKVADNSVHWSGIPIGASGFQSFGTKIGCSSANGKADIYAPSGTYQVRAGSNGVLYSTSISAPITSLTVPLRTTC